MKKLKTYSFKEYIYLSICWIRTRIFYPKVRLIRFPIDLRGRQYIDFGLSLTTGRGCRIEAFPIDKNKVISFGDNVQINDYVHITAMNSVVIGNNVLMASNIYISDCSHGKYDGDESTSPNIPPIERIYEVKSVLIGDNVWIGENVSILPGVTIGEGSIIGANSVVTKDIPPCVIAVGVPAKPIKMYNFATQKWEKT